MNLKEWELKTLSSQGSRRLPLTLTITAAWLSAVLLTTCHTASPYPVTPAFYCWQTTLALSPTQREYLEQTGVKKLYVKVADVGLDPGTREIIPYAQLHMGDTTGLSKFDIAGVVFITNEVFYRVTPEQIDFLAGKIAALFKPLAPLQLPGGRHECQIDCDWTEGTRVAFFHFLKVLRTKIASGTCLSATIRLHQYKFPDRTGVPPVDRGMLMCYNTGDVEAAETNNSIFDSEAVKKYVSGAAQKYPLPLDLALPVFSWILVYRADELWKIIPGKHESFPQGALASGTFLEGHYLRPGDWLRRESISVDLLKKAAYLAASTDLAEDATLAFFSLETTTPIDYPAPLIDEVCKIADTIRVKK